MSQPTIARTLSKAILKPEVRIKLKIWNTYLTGKLVKFDNYMNLIVENAKEIYFGRGGKRSKDIGNLFWARWKKKQRYRDCNDQRCFNNIHWTR